MTKPNYQLEFFRQRIEGIFFCKNDVEQEECRRLVQDLGCAVVTERPHRLTIQTSRGRLQELKRLHVETIDDKAQISSRLKSHFEKILIGGTPSRH